MTFTRADTMNIAILLFLSCIWGTAFAAIKIAVIDIGPFGVAAARSLIGGLTLFVFLVLIGSPAWRVNKSLLTAQNLRILFFIGLVGTLAPFFLISWAETRLDSNLVGLLISTGPLITALGGHFITGEEEVTPARFGVISLGFLGVIILMYEGVLQVGSMSLLAQFAVVLASGCYAAGNLIAWRLTMIEPAKLACLSLLIAASVMVPTAFLNNVAHPASWQADTWWALCWLGMVSSGFAFSLRYVLIKRAGAGFMANVGYLIPVVAVLVGGLFLGESLGLEKLIAMALIITSVILSQRFAVRLKRKKAE